MIPKFSISSVIIKIAKSQSLWRTLFLLVAAYHILTWSSPFPSTKEAVFYESGINGTAQGFVWILLTRTVDQIFSFAYAKFAFVVIGLGSIALIYLIFRRVAGENVAIVSSIFVGTNSFVFSIWHSTRPEIVVFFIFLLAIFLFVKFSSYWHLNLTRSANVTIAGLLAISILVVNVDINAICFLPSIFLMIFMVAFRVQPLSWALIATSVVLITFLALQFLIMPSYFESIYKIIFDLGADYEKNNSVIFSIHQTYIDGYKSPIWDYIHPYFNFLFLANAPIRSKELVTLVLAIILSIAVLGLKFFRIFLQVGRKNDFFSIFRGTNLPLVLIFGFSFATSILIVCIYRGLSSEALFYFVTSGVLFLVAVYAFLLSARKGFGSNTKSAIFYDAMYIPLAKTASGVLLLLGLTNAFLYVVPYRGSNYPTMFDALEQLWKGSGCQVVSYGPAELNLALPRFAGGTKTLDEFFDDIKHGRSLGKGCVVTTLTARDGAYQYKSYGEIRNKIESVFKNQYQPVAHLTLPFYQKDPAFPYSENFSIENKKELYERAYGQIPYGFGGMQDIIIYKPNKR